MRGGDRVVVDYVGIVVAVVVDNTLLVDGGQRYSNSVVGLGFVGTLGEELVVVDTLGFEGVVGA